MYNYPKTEVTEAKAELKAFNENAKSFPPPALLPRNQRIRRWTDVEGPHIRRKGLIGTTAALIAGTDIILGELFDRAECNAHFNFNLYGSTEDLEQEWDQVTVSQKTQLKAFQTVQDQSYEKLALL